MATIDIGKLTFTHKGDYAGGTAYVANDVVYYNGSAYIAKTSTTGNLPTSTAHWNTFAAGSGGIWNAGLSLGSANQVVAVNSGASALEFQNISSDVVKLATTTLGSNASYISIDGFFNDTIYSKYEVEWAINVQSGSSSSNCHLSFRFNAGGSPNTSSEYHGALNHFGNNNPGGFNDIRQNSLASSWAKRNEFQMSNTWNENEVKTYNCKNRGVMQIYEPQSTTHTKQFTYLTSIGTNNQSGGWTAGGMGHGIWQVPGTAASGVSFHFEGGQNVEAGSRITLWGFKK